MLDFHRTSATVQGVIVAAEKKLSRLGKMVDRTRTIHSSNEAAITQLIASVKSDMAEASETVGTLDKVVGHINRRGSQLHDHCLRVVEFLEGRTLVLAGRFKALLKKRQEHMKSSSKRKEIFGEEFAQLGRPMTTTIFGPSAPAAEGGFMMPGGGGGGGSGAAPRIAAGGGGGGAAAADLALMTQLTTAQTQLIPDQDYYQQRSQSMTDIESTIVELGGMFDSLSSMIEYHGETINEIAENVEDSLAHSQAAVVELEEAWRNTEGNKMLYFKIFMILMAFMAFFITFLA